jgi:serine/threonine-protein kinase RsbW
MAIPDFEHCLGADLAGIPTLWASFNAWGTRAALSARETYQVNLVLEELVTNVIVHGLGERGPGWVRVRVAHGADRLLIELRDTAPPFDPFTAPAPRLTPGIEQREVGGLGVHLVRALMDGWRYARADGQNLVSLHKMLGGSR